MPQWIKSGSSWYIKHTKTNGSTTPSNNHDLLNRWIYTTINGVASWRPIYKYRWALSDWSACSVTCGGGTKTKTFECIREDGYTGSTKHKDGTYTGTLVSNNHCVKSGLTTPSGSTIKTSCNTHSCTLYYRATSDDYQQMWVKYRKGDGWTDIGIAQTGCDRNGGCSTAALSSASYGAFTANSNYDGQTVYCKYSHWDSNGTSWHAHLRLSPNGNNWTEHIVHFPYNGAGRHNAGSRTYYWFIWNTKTNAITYVAAATNSANTACGGSGGYKYTSYMSQWWVNGSVRGCGTGEPF